MPDTFLSNIVVHGTKARQFALFQKLLCIAPQCKLSAPCRVLSLLEAGQARPSSSRVVHCILRVRVWRLDIPTMEQLPNGRMRRRVVGVSFEGRQERVRKLRPGQELVLCKHSGNGYDTYAIGIFDLADRENPLGFVGRDIKDHKVFDPVRNGIEMPARVHRINRGRGYHGPWGFMVEVNDLSMNYGTGSSACSDPAPDDTVCQIVLKRRT